MEGFVLFDKPKGYTSAEIVEIFKKKTKKKVGHGGTLDPLATGLLILAVGDEYTKKLSKFLKESKKIYLAEITLGYTSTTFDSEGEIQKVGERLPSIKEVETTLKKFIGEIEQIPPVYSSVKIKGRPVYELARAGISISLKPRKVFIESIKILDYNPPKLILEVKSGSGVYIRSLANDLGNELKCGGYLSGLRRTKIDEFSVDEAINLEDLKKNYFEVEIIVYGIVQGVGYRNFAMRSAINRGINGFAQNLRNGTVKIIAQGSEEKLQEFLNELKIGPSIAKVDRIEPIFKKPLKFFEKFYIF